MTTAISCAAILAGMLFLLGFNVSRMRGVQAKAGGSQLPTDPADRLLIAIRRTCSAWRWRWRPPSRCDGQPSPGGLRPSGERRPRLSPLWRREVSHQVRAYRGDGTVAERCRAMREIERVERGYLRSG